MGWEEIFSQTGEATNTDFGYSVAISGNYAIVGAREFNSNQGKVYWHERQNDGKWREVHTQTGEATNTDFGNSVAISGNYAIVGAEGFDNPSTGKAYWYERQNDGEWREVHTQTGEATNNNFGRSVAISGNYAIVGAPGFEENQGKVYWHERQNDGKWREVHTQTKSALLGNSVAISGNYAIVGAYGDTLLTGKVYWYERQNDGKWREVHTQTGETVRDFFGYSVAISRNYAIVGAIGFDNPSTGKAYWYERQNDGGWKEVHTQPGENTFDRFGQSVAISGNYAIVGADEFPGGSGPGKAYFHLKKY